MRKTAAHELACFVRPTLRNAKNNPEGFKGPILPSAKNRLSNYQIVKHWMFDKKAGKNFTISAPRFSAKKENAKTFHRKKGSAPRRISNQTPRRTFSARLDKFVRITTEGLTFCFRCYIMKAEGLNMEKR